MKEILREMLEIVKERNESEGNGFAQVMVRYAGSGKVYNYGESKIDAIKFDDVMYLAIAYKDKDKDMIDFQLVYKDDSVA